ncbi:uncharacterized protein PFLUO_LOCUS2796 [Penicillium psychrofluorescens]|uniref:uncharacterized protein n=1 Tax=Penicillium psychrofluorescens TaxID=3158075 RepID=UPI003CCDDA68
MFSSFTSSSAISNLGSRLTNLRRAITLGDEGDDPENEDCSHISNALRAYYTEKGRPFPPWLPPDPKAPAPSPSRIIATTQIPASGPYNQPAAAVSVPYARGGGGLGDLWGDTGNAPLPTQTASLRRPRGRGGEGGGSGVPPGLNVHPPLSPAFSAPAGPMPSPHPSPSPPPGSLHPSGARPLPSQRVGSYQGQSARLDRTASSAQERLRARLHGGQRSPSPREDPSVRKPVGMSGRR